MSTILQTLALIAIITGTLFSIVGVLGFIRMPDVYTRLHSSGKVGIFGVVLLTVATVATTSLSFWKGLVLIALLILTGPVVTHAIASSAYRVGIPLKRAIRDDLSEQIISDPGKKPS